jgi:hypothetical protein
LSGSATSDNARDFARACFARIDDRFDRLDRRIDRRLDIAEVASQA